MKIKIINVLLCFAVALNVSAQSDDTLQTQSAFGSLIIHPVHHASFVISARNKTIFFDPTGGAAAFTGMKAPDMILITDIHGDHFDPKTIDAVKGPGTMLIVPQAVADKLSSTDKSRLVVLRNGGQKEISGISIKAIPMYNLPETADSFHPKGRGNGYVLTIGGKHIYVSGDTEDIPEMRKLKNIDVAFICMNLPYTMDIQQASSAVLEFKPKVVYPYHYQGENGLSDVKAFQKLVNDVNPKIEVRLREWYRGQ